MAGANVYALEAIVPDALKLDSTKDSPVDTIRSVTLVQMGQNLNHLFTQFKSDRQLAEQRWLRNQRQYLGIYDPDVEKELQPNRSRAFPKITRVKVISILAKIMNLMFQGNDRNWTLKAKPWPDMTEADVRMAVAKAQKADQAGGGQARLVDKEYVMAAIKLEAQSRAKDVMDLIDDQMEEIGGDQTIDYVALNRKAIGSGLLYGLGVLRGPFAREGRALAWDTSGAVPIPKEIKCYKPEFEFLTVWDFYPDMAAQNFKGMDGYFIRKVMSRGQLRALANRSDFMGGQIKAYLNMHPIGNYRPQWFDSELRAMGVKANVNEQKIESSKYEVLVWHGPITGAFLTLCGEEIEAEKLADDIDAEVWMIDGIVIKGVMNPWRKLDVSMNMLHTYCYDEDDTSPIGFGVPTAMRDSQMAVSASARMLLDNASVVCGPNIEVNTDLMRPDQDVSAITAYKVWYREGTGVEAQWPAVRNVQIDAHMDSLMKMIDLFMRIADQETFVGPANGGDMQQGPSEPFRTAAGASMLRGEAALPFKDMIRAFDLLTASVVNSVLIFNQKFNPELLPKADFDVIARGASSLMAKEARGAAADNMAATLTPEEKLYVDAKKLLMARACARDLDDIVVDDDEAGRREAQQAQVSSTQTQQAQALFEANVRKTLSDAFKSITQGQKNTAAADAQSVDAALQLLEQGMAHGIIQSGGMGPGQADQPGVPGAGPGDPGDPQAAQPSPGDPQGPDSGGGDAGQPPSPPG